MYEYDTSSESTARGRTPTSDRNPGLIVVSNRQPYRHTYDEDGALAVDRPTGGLTAGLDPVLQAAGGTWIAWGDGDGDRDAVDEDGSVRVPPDDPSYTLHRVWLSGEEVDGYYYGFANQVLWPICHSSVSTVRAGPSFWPRYREVNERFADAVADRHEPGSPVWFQDYHLALAPGMLRERLPDAGLLHFWHVPWPDWETFRACPHGEAIVRGLLGNDLLGFHLRRYAESFMACADAALPEATVDWEGSRVRYGDRSTRVVAAPMGVRTDRIRDAATSETAETFPAEFRADHGIGEDTRIAIGVDRLDYTKGIPQRLRALERLWERFPQWRGALTYVQSASESRSEIPAYRDVQETVAEEVERINDRFGTDGWQPVVYSTEWLSREELFGLYRHADVAIVSPVRDGMNLVAQEYVAARTDADGVLVLSEQAGVHEVLGDYALTIDPNEVEAFAETVHEALTMPAAERRRRMVGLRRRVSEIDLSTWTETFAERAAELAGPHAAARTA